MTIIEVQTDKQKIDITHRIFAHDLEHIFNLGNAGMDFFETKEGVELIKNYMGRTFYIGNPDGPIDAKFVGVELAGDLIFIYFEADIKNSKSLIIDSSILEDFSIAQVNFVNVHFADKTKTLLFRNGEEKQVVVLSE